jgi:hypothetical protein
MSFSDVRSLRFIFHFDGNSKPKVTYLATNSRNPISMMLQDTNAPTYLPDLLRSTKT